jgi:hypothetical protein
MVVAAGATALVALMIGRALDRDLADAIFLALLQAPTAIPVLVLAGVGLSRRDGWTIPAVYIATLLTVACQIIIFGLGAGGVLAAPMTGPFLAAAGGMLAGGACTAAAAGGAWAADRL